MNSETRFFKRKAHLINFDSLTQVMRELLDDKTLEIERNYPTLSFYSYGWDRCYEEDEIMQRIGDYIGATKAACFIHSDLEIVYFIEDK